ncbi:MAG: hypothetical protein KKB25_00500 [Nanoarchaeota archaeon]|nr:hypothetical protein [Nanoarchaeota archaeon]
MIEFKMPKETDVERYEKFRKALEAAGINIEEERFFLDIKEGEILTIVNDRIGFENLQRELSLGCAANVPSIKCFHASNGNRLSYVRMLNSDAANEGLYNKNVPIIGKITEALSNPVKYTESLSANRRGKNAIVQSENRRWYLTVNGNEIIGSGRDGVCLEAAVGFMLNFYETNNL